SQAVSEFRKMKGVDGPLFLGIDTHALSRPALETAIEVLVANGVELRVQRDAGFTPTPVISHAVLGWNRGRTSGLSDGIVLTPSHTPPQDGGFKYNPTHGGPAGTESTSWIEKRSNDLLLALNREVKTVPIEHAVRAPNFKEVDLIRPYVDDLRNVIDFT